MQNKLDIYEDISIKGLLYLLLENFENSNELNSSKKIWDNLVQKYFQENRTVDLYNVLYELWCNNKINYNTFQVMVLSLVDNENEQNDIIPKEHKKSMLNVFSKILKTICVNISPQSICYKENDILKDYINIATIINNTLTARNVRSKSISGISTNIIKISQEYLFNQENIVNPATKISDNTKNDTKLSIGGSISNKGKQEVFDIIKNIDMYD